MVNGDTGTGTGEDGDGLIIRRTTLITDTQSQEAKGLCGFFVVENMDEYTSNLFPMSPDSNSNTMSLENAAHRIDMAPIAQIPPNRNQVFYKNVTDLKPKIRITSKNPGKLLGTLFVEPCPTDPEFIRLCKKYEDQGIRISNNPELGELREFLPLPIYNNYGEKRQKLTDSVISGLNLEETTTPTGARPARKITRPYRKAVLSESSVALIMGTINAVILQARIYHAKVLESKLEAQKKFDTESIKSDPDLGVDTEAEAEAESESDIEYDTSDSEPETESGTEPESQEVVIIKELSKEEKYGVDEEDVIDLISNSPPQPLDEREVSPEPIRLEVELELEQSVADLFPVLKFRKSASKQTAVGQLMKPPHPMNWTSTERNLESKECSPPPVADFASPEIRESTKRIKKTKLVNTNSGFPGSKEEEALIETMRKKVKKNPDLAYADIKEGMKETFISRNKWIRKGEPVETIFRIFPALGLKKIWDMEFKLCAKRKLSELRRRLQPQLDLFQDKPTPIIQHKCRTCKKALRALKSTTLEPGTNDFEELQNSVAMLRLWHELVPNIKEDGLYKYLDSAGNEMPEDIENKPEPSEPTIDLPEIPYIVITHGKKIVATASECEMVVYAEHTEICRRKSFYASILAVYQVYWIFMINYDVNVKELFDYFDEVLEI